MTISGKSLKMSVAISRKQQEDTVGETQTRTLRVKSYAGLVSFKTATLSKQDASIKEPQWPCGHLNTCRGLPEDTSHFSPLTSFTVTCYICTWRQLPKSHHQKEKQKQKQSSSYNLIMLSSYWE